MAEEKAEPAQPTMPNMKILAQYIRDMSFENILSQKGRLSVFPLPYNRRVLLSFVQNNVYCPRSILTMQYTNTILNFSYFDRYPIHKWLC